MLAQRPAGLEEDNLGQKTPRRKAGPSTEQGLARTNSDDSLAVWQKDQSALVHRWGAVDCHVWVLHALVIIMSSNARREGHTCPEGRR